jgi:hypothetical protein
MAIDDYDDNSRAVLEAVDVLALSERLPARLVEELLQPEFSDGAQSLGAGPYDFGSLRATLGDRLQARLDREGLDHAATAAYLGMTEDSFAELRRQPWLQLRIHRNSSGEERFLKEDVDALTDSYLPRFRTWTNRTSLLTDFFRELQARKGFVAKPQPCEIEGCPRLANVVCVNPDCRRNGPRKVCAAHYERLRDPIEKSLCAICIPRVLYGDLHGRFRIAGTEERLMRDYPR